jgi:hypothetical protein
MSRVSFSFFVVLRLQNFGSTLHESNYNVHSTATTSSFNFWSARLCDAQRSNRDAVWCASDR